MRLPDLARTTAFRWTLGIAAWSALLAFILFAFVYWQTAVYERERLDSLVSHEGRLLAQSPAETVADRLSTWLAEDLHNVRFAALFAADGRPLAGNMVAPPQNLPADGAVREVMIDGAIDQDSDSRREVIHAVALRLTDNRLLVVGHDTDQLEHTRAVVLRALGLGLVPTLGLALAGGLLLARRAQQRVRAVHESVGRVMRGQLGERLPVQGTDDEFDRLAASVNTMLAELERLVGEIRSVGDAIAHDLRTPLTRARARLERSRALVRTPELQEVMDHTLAGLDQTLTIITAVLRIGEIEHGLRRAAFERVSLDALLREVVELYDPIAEEKGVRLVTDLQADLPPTIGDKDLLFEAVTNLVDNAIKFVHAGGCVRLSLAARNDALLIRVEDNGPGIPSDERDQVLKRFFRSERSRHLEGSGLGLSLVVAVAGLHGFRITLGDNAPGCIVEIACSPAPEVRECAPPPTGPRRHPSARGLTRRDSN